MRLDRGRISFGSHPFPFRGLQAEEGPPLAVPMIPVKFRPAGGTWSMPVNAVLDTGSTRTMLPRTLGIELGLSPREEAQEIQGSGADFEASSAPADLRIVDAHYPDVTCWSIDEFEVWLPGETAALAYPVVGWDVLEHFEMVIDPRRKRFELRLIVG